MKNITIIAILAVLLIAACSTQPLLSDNTSKIQVLPLNVTEPEQTDKTNAAIEQETPEEVIGEPASKTYTITIDNNGFRPAVLTIAVGDTVLWKNARTIKGTMANAYLVGSSIACRRPKLESKYPPGILVGETFNHTFTQAGECIYVDGIQTTKKGTIIIK